MSGVDVLGADLSDANLTGAYLYRANLPGARLDRAQDMALLMGATWNLCTSRPERLAPVVAEQSDEVSPGVYRVRGEQADDRSGSARV